MTNVMRLAILSIAVVVAYAAIATLIEAAGREHPAVALDESQMSTRNLILQIPVQIKIPETGLSGVTLVATADKGAGLVRCGGPSYALLRCTPGDDTATLVVVDINNRWFVPGRNEWVGTFHLWRVDFQSGTYTIVVEAVRADDDNGNPVEIPPMTMTIDVR